MHEWGLVRAAAAELAEVVGDAPVARLVVQTGPGVDPDVAAAAWKTEVGSTGTGPGAGLAGADVRWEPAQDGLCCLSCGRAYPGDSLSRCPACGGNGLVVEPAAEIAVVEWVPYDGERTAGGG